MCLLAIDALRIDEGAAASSVLEDIAEVVADDLLRHLLILLLASGQGIVVVHVGVDGTPIVCGKVSPNTWRLPNQ